MRHAISMLAMLAHLFCGAQEASIRLEYESPSQEGETTCKEFYIESINSILELSDCDEEFDRIEISGTDKIAVCAKNRKEARCERIKDGSLDRQEMDIFAYETVILYFEGYKIASIRISKPKCK